MKRQFKIKTIRTKKEYKEAMSSIDLLFDAKPNTQEGDVLEVLSILVEKYEEEHFVIDNPVPLEAIKFRMEQLGLTTIELATLLGGKNRVSEIFNGKRNLSLTMVRNLYKEWGIPAESLLGA